MHVWSIRGAYGVLYPNLTLTHLESRGAYGAHGVPYLNQP